jgi:SWI/SNF-related matrix-associated actin-dependent regulator of chromatin subfamily A member 5
MGTMRNATSTDPTEADDADKTEDDAPRMTRGELASILRGGTSALAKWGTDGTDAFTQFRESTFEDLREKGRLRDEKKEVGIKVDLGESVDERSLKDLEREEEEAERLLLAGREAVQAR